MRKSVMAGLTVPTVLLAAVALCGPAMAAEDDGQGKLNDRTLNSRKVDTERARPAADRADLSDTTAVLAAQEGRIDARGTRDGRAATATADRADRRGRQAPRRTDAGALIDEEAWAWHGCKGEGNCLGHDHDEDEDEDDDEDQSPPAP